MPERGLGAAEGRVDARALPLAASDVRGRADPAPHVAGHVGRVDHLVGFLRSALGELEELPHAIEGRDCELPLPGGVHQTATAGSPASAIATSSSEYSWSTSLPAA